MPEEDPTARLAHEMRETLGRLVRRIRREGGPSVQKLVVLSRLERDGTSTVGELALAERMRPQSMAQAVHELEDAGLVTRRPDPGDRRRQFVDLTPAGRDLVDATRRAREGWLTETLERELAPDERAVVAEAMRLLRRVADA